MATVTVGELRDYLKELADAVVNGKMQVTDADVKTVLDTIKSVLQSGVNTYDTNALAELQAIKNKLNGTLLTQLTGSNIPDTQGIPIKNFKKIQLDTLVNAESVAANGSYKIIPLNPTTEDEIWIMINIDQQPWDVRCNSIWASTSSQPTAEGRGLFPIRNGEAKTYTNISYPAISLYLGSIQPGPAEGLAAPATMFEARQFMTPYWPGAEIRVVNRHETNPATLTVRVLRVWRGAR